MIFNVKVLTNCFWPATEDFFKWAEQNKEWILPINAHPDNDYGMTRLSDIKKFVQMEIMKQLKENNK